MGPFEGLGPDIVEGIRRIKSLDGPDLILSGRPSPCAGQAQGLCPRSARSVLDSEALIALARRAANEPRPPS
jgi:hypothetical protein